MRIAGGAQARAGPTMTPMDTFVIIVQADRRGRAYPIGRVLPPEQRQRAASLAHALIHRDKLSIRAAQRVMLEQYGLRRSRGSIGNDLVRLVCPSCENEP